MKFATVDLAGGRRLARGRRRKRSVSLLVLLGTIVALLTFWSLLGEEELIDTEIDTGVIEYDRHLPTNRSATAATPTIFRTTSTTTMHSLRVDDNASNADTVPEWLHFEDEIALAPMLVGDREVLEAPVVTDNANSGAELSFVERLQSVRAWPKVCIAFLSCNRLQILRTAMHSMLRHALADEPLALQRSLHFVWLDNGSSNRSEVEEVRRTYGGVVRSALSPTNLGFAEGTNTLWWNVCPRDSEFLLPLEEDFVYVGERAPFIAAALSVMSSDARVGTVFLRNVPTVKRSWGDHNVEFSVHEVPFMRVFPGNEKRGTSCTAGALMRVTALRDGGRFSDTAHDHGVVEFAQRFAAAGHIAATLQLHPSCNVPRCSCVLHHAGRDRSPAWHDDLGVHRAVPTAECVPSSAIPLQLLASNVSASATAAARLAARLRSVLTSGGISLRGDCTLLSHGDEPTDRIRWHLRAAHVVVLLDVGGYATDGTVGEAPASVHTRTGCADVMMIAASRGHPFIERWLTTVEPLVGNADVQDTQRCMPSVPPEYRDVVVFLPISLVSSSLAHNLKTVSTENVVSCTAPLRSEAILASGRGPPVPSWRQALRVIESNMREIDVHAARSHIRLIYEMRVSGRTARIEELPPMFVPCLLSILRVYARASAAIHLYSNTMPVALVPMAWRHGFTLHWHRYTDGTVDALVPSLRDSLQAVRASVENHDVHLSDLLRLALVYALGGYYFDSDIIHLRPLEAVLRNRPLLTVEDGSRDPPTPWFVTSTVMRRWLACSGGADGVHVPSVDDDDNQPRFSWYVQNNAFGSGSERDHAFLGRLVDDLPAHFRASCWNCIGPRLFTERLVADVVEADTNSSACSLAPTLLTYVPFIDRKLDTTLLGVSPRTRAFEMRTVNSYGRDFGEVCDRLLRAQPFVHLGGKIFHQSLANDSFLIALASQCTT